MVNKKVSPTRPQSPAVPQRKAPATAPKRGASTASGTGNPVKTPTQGRTVTAPPRSGVAARLEGVQRTFRETVAELKKVQWPDRMTTRNLTLVVIGMSTVLAIILGLLDAGLTWAIEWLVRLPIGG